MAGHRMDRLTQDLRRELADIIRNMKDPRATGIISVGLVELAQDLSIAKVHVSTLDGNSAATAKALNGASGYVRHELSERLRIRKTPALKFVPDDSIEQSVRMSKLISDVSKSDVSKSDISNNDISKKENEG
ncbi:MAG: 30S ribosome-binding factor RbfA [Clostridia bacterium]|nr:30S ribosome-binding factor RbfA [Clostridia bacterium]